MKNDMMWAYYMELSNHMWDDETSEPRGWYLEPMYKPENDNDFDVWRETVDFLAERKFNTVLIDVGDAVKLEKHPEISAPNALCKTELDELLGYIRARGLTPIPKLNFSCCHQTWMKEYRRMAGTELYRAVCRDLIDEVCELFGKPGLFHLGLDEETYDMQVFSECITIRREPLWLKDVRNLFDTCAKNGARPWMWGDYFWAHPESFAENISKDVLISNWFYFDFTFHPEGDYSRIAIDTYEQLDKLGYEQVPTCSTWNNDHVTFQTLAHGKAKLTPSLVKGYMTAAWVKTVREKEFALKNDAQHLFDARKKVYPETL